MIIVKYTDMWYVKSKTLSLLSISINIISLGHNKFLVELPCQKKDKKITIIIVL